MSSKKISEHFIRMAEEIAKGSNDPVTKVGACIVNNANEIVGVGCNNFPNGSENENFPWNKEGTLENTKYAYVVHAEMNAIFNAMTNINGNSIYVTHYPCNECAKGIIQTGIKRVVYKHDKNPDDGRIKASERMFHAAGIEIHQLKDL